MIGLAAAWMWGLVAAGGLLALLSLIMAVALGFMLSAPLSAGSDTIGSEQQGQGQ